MRFDTGFADHQMLLFASPGWPDITLSVSQSEVLEITTLPPVTPLPFSPRHITGVCLYRNQVVTVFDLGRAFFGCDAPHPTETVAMQHVIAQRVKGTERDLIAWPVLPGASVASAPAQAPAAEFVHHHDPRLVRAIILFREAPVVLLALEKLN